MKFLRALVVVVVFLIYLIYLCIIYCMQCTAERETETLNHARQLVFRNDHNIVPQPPSHLGYVIPSNAPRSIEIQFLLF